MNRGKLCATVSFWHDFNRICDAADHSWAVIQYYIHANLCDHHQRRTDFLSSELAPDCVESPGNRTTRIYQEGRAEQTFVKFLFGLWKNNSTDFPLLPVPVPSNSLPFLSISVKQTLSSRDGYMFKEIFRFSGMFGLLSSLRVEIGP